MDRQTDRQTDTTKLMVAFRNFTNAPKNYTAIRRMELVCVSVTARSEPKGVKPKMGEDKLKSGVNWQGALKHNGRKTDGRKMKLGYNSIGHSPSRSCYASDGQEIPHFLGTHEIHYLGPKTLNLCLYLETAESSPQSIS